MQRAEHICDSNIIEKGQWMLTCDKNVERSIDVDMPNIKT